MKIMTGIGLHSINAPCGLMDESGRRLVHKKTSCELPDILQLLDLYKNRIATLVIESTNTTGIGWPKASSITATRSCWPTTPGGSLRQPQAH